MGVRWGGVGRVGAAWFLVLALSACGDDTAASSDAASHDAPTPDAPIRDAAADAPLPDAMTDACSLPADDGGTSGGPVCACGPSGVCGTGTIADPFRCCDVAEDGCVVRRIVGSYDPCQPLRCSIEPDCCIVGTCPSPIDQNCGGATFTCIRYDSSGIPGNYNLPDNTPCDDGRPYTSASPAPTLTDCVGTDGAVGGPSCTRDRPPSGAVTTDCPTTAPICSGTGAALGGTNGGAIVSGRCCPQGTGCDLDATSTTYLKCLGNFGKGKNSNDVCRNGVCSWDVSTMCGP